MVCEPYPFVPTAHTRKIRLGCVGQVSVADAVVVGLIAGLVALVCRYVI